MDFFIATLKTGYMINKVLMNSMICVQMQILYWILHVSGDIHKHVRP